MTVRRSQHDDWRAAIARVRETYARRQGRALKLFGARRYTEKVQWRKLFDLNPVYAVTSDKLAARAFIAARLGRDACVPLLWNGDDPDRIPFDALTPPYVIKSTHASGHHVFVAPGKPVDRDAIRTVARGWLAHCHGTPMDEPAYVHVPRRLVVERQVFAPDGSRPLERRIFVFGGRARVVNTVFVEADRVRNGAFHTPDWTRLPWHFTRALPGLHLPRPALLDAMLDIAGRVGRGFDHVRVDLYDCVDRVYVGELTLYPWSGLERINPDTADAELGALWTLRFPRLRALKRVLFDRREIRPGSAPCG